MPDDDPRPLKRPEGAPPLYAQDGSGMLAIVHDHYFLGASDWLVTEYDPAADEAFGWACLGGDRQNAELGYTSLAELAEVRAPMHVQLPNGDTHVTVVMGYARVERDDHWPAGLSLAEGIARLDARSGEGD